MHKLIACCSLIILFGFTSDAPKDQRSGVFDNEHFLSLKDDSLFKLEFLKDENLVVITPPAGSDFSLPDSSDEIYAYEYRDFNADNKEDVLVRMGACGTGGCMYGLFLKQHDNHYKIAFFDYLKNVEYETDENGFWLMRSIEELRPYDPSVVAITIYKFDKTTYSYQLDTGYIYIDPHYDTEPDEK